MAPRGPCRYPIVLSCPRSRWWRRNAAPTRIALRRRRPARVSESKPKLLRSIGAMPLPRAVTRGRRHPAAGVSHARLFLVQALLPLRRLGRVWPAVVGAVRAPRRRGRPDAQQRSRGCSPRPLLLMVNAAVAVQTRLTSQPGRPHSAGSPSSSLVDHELSPRLHHVATLPHCPLERLAYHRARVQEVIGDLAPSIHPPRLHVGREPRWCRNLAPVARRKAGPESRRTRTAVLALRTSSASLNSLPSSPSGRSRALTERSASQSHFTLARYSTSQRRQTPTHGDS